MLYILKEVSEIMFETCQKLLTSSVEGNFTELAGACPFFSSVAGGALLGSLIAIGAIVAMIVIIGIYIYTSLAYFTIAKKLNHPNAWIAWFPIVRLVILLEMGSMHWAWIFLLFIPIFGWIALFVLFIISMWRIFERLGHPGWFSLSVLIPRIGGLLYLIAIGFAAWSGKKIGAIRKVPTKKASKKSPVKIAKKKAKKK